MLTDTAQFVHMETGHNMLESRLAFMVDYVGV